MHHSLLSMFDLAGQSAIVTGASRGLGVSFARGLAKAGCNLALVARDLEALTGIANEIEGYGARVITIRADVRSEKDIDGAVKHTLDEFGRLDILVNNAGISAVAPAEDMTAQQWQDVIDTNLTAVFLCAQRVGKHMLEAGSGTIINIASMYASSAASFVPQASYVASKSGLLGLTRELAVEWAPRGVRVVALAPGFFRSEQTIWAFEENKDLGQKLLAKVPMGRMGKLEELEAAIVYLASPASGYMTGQALVIDGGFLAW